MLLIHGDDDRNVPFIAVGQPGWRRCASGTSRCEQLVFPDEVHDFLRHGNWIRAYKASADFLQRKLAGRKGSGSH